MQKIPKHFRSQPRDRFVSCIRPGGEVMIQMELEFEHHLDIDRLTKALELTLDAEPILGCRLVSGFWAPRWERVDKDERSIFSFTNDENKYEAFKHAGSDPLSGPQIKACLLRTAGSDHLLLKVNHEVCDASGVRYATSVLSSIYSRLADDPGYLPASNINNPRGPWQVLRCIPYYAYPVIWYNFFRRNTFAGVFPIVSARLPEADDSCETLEYVTRRIPENIVQHITEYGRQRKSTVNDLMLASFFHALTSVSDWNGQTQLRVVIPVDIRRYRTNWVEDGICNLFGLELLDLGTDLGDTFDHTLERISSHMHRRKAGWIGINDWVGLTPVNIFMPYAITKRFIPRFMKFALKIGSTPYCFTNMGAIDKDKVTFDQPPVGARLLPSIDYAPHIVYGISSYDGSLTISAGSCSSRREQLEQMFDEMVNALPAPALEKVSVAL